jgi:Flp pilus assembly protein TadG
VIRVFRSKDRDERGAVAVEFALVLPLVLMMVLALLQIGLWAKDQLVVLEVARAGAREGAVTRDDHRTRQVAEDAASSLETSRLEIQVERGGELGTPVTVTVLYEDPPVLPFVGWLFPATVRLHATATMRQEVA